MSLPHLRSIVAVLPLLLIHHVHNLGVVRSVLHDVEQELCLWLWVRSNIYSLLRDTSRPEHSSEEDDYNEKLHEGAVPVGWFCRDGGHDGLQERHHQHQAQQAQTKERRSPEVEGLEQIVAEGQEQVERGVEAKVERYQALEYLQVNLSHANIRLVI